ncbi:acetyltransferase [Rhizobiaceae bacterium BDR2-2]|uniref:Acetyltransferase n=1 Tax=Ectorhizobium quercum TaxID=2965071 RepID=A0AAE3MVA6_9HYPH|nr:GNAT family N-acetyltransferase [Ectorhizobium quercum]MCX8995838.1 acetyltransferase [Ectorhizobium quercum]
MDRSLVAQQRASASYGAGFLMETADDLVFKTFHLDGKAMNAVRRAGPIVSVSSAGAETAFFRLSLQEGLTELEAVEGAAHGAQGRRFACAVFEYLFATYPNLRSLSLKGDYWLSLLPEFRQHGPHILVDGLFSQPYVLADMFWQTANLWMTSGHQPYPRHDVYDGRIAHPSRPPKPQGRLYARFIPWLGGTLSFDVATLEDLPDIHRWMNDPRVNEFWNEAGDEDRHRRYLEGMFSDPHIIPLIGRFDEKAFSYFEIYWAKEDIIGTFCDAGDYDRGCHVIVGEDAFRGQPWYTAWLPSLLHLMFLDDARTERIIQEPSSRHFRQLRNLQRSGFSHIKSVDLPTKRAAIMSISRQRFFSDRLWHPAHAPDEGL